MESMGPSPSTTMNSVAPTSSADGMPMAATMQNFFQWSAQVTVLFRSWKTENSGVKYFFTLLAVFLLAMLYQWLSRFRLSLAAKFKRANVSADRSSVPEVSAGDNVSSNLEGGTNEVAKATLAKTYPKWTKLLVSLLLGMSVALGYLLMLCVMSFNVGIFLAVVFGITIADLFCDN